jgi:hypothetical protein
MNGSNNWWFRSLGAVVIILLYILLVSHASDGGFLLSFFGLLVNAVKAIVWPLAAVLVVYILREPLGEILRSFAGRAQTRPSAVSSSAPDSAKPEGPASPPAT